MSDVLSFHRMLLTDDDRMKAYRQALRQTVRAGDVVLDVGAGSGIMGMFACQAGARRVYAVDRGEIIIAARQLAEANGFGDRIHFLRKDVRDVELPEPVDVIVSELISKSVLGQNMAEIIGFCQERFLKPGGKIVPERVTLCIAPLEDESLYENTSFPDPSTYGIDFATMQARSFHHPVDGRVPAQALLAQGQIAYTYDIAAGSNADQLSATLVFQPERAGTLHGFGAWFVAVLAEGVELSNRPPGIGAWDNMVFPVPQAVAIEPDMTIELRLRGKSDAVMQDMWCWDTTIRRETQIIATFRQSTFLGTIIAPEVLQKRAAAHVPALSVEGRVEQFILALMDGQHSLDEIARRLAAQLPDRLPRWQDALTKVGDLSEQYGQ